METFEEMEARHLRERIEMRKRCMTDSYNQGLLGRSVVQFAGQQSNIIERHTLYICERHGVTREQLKSPERTKDIVRARQELMHLLICAGMSVAGIGRYLNRDHTTILHGVRAHKKRNGIEQAASE